MLSALAGDGGIIVLDRSEYVAINFNIKGMYRGHAEAGNYIIKDI